MHYWVWLAMAGGFIVLEILTLSLIFFSFAIAASIAAVGAAVAAVLSLAVVRPIVRKYLFRKSSGGATGMDALLNHEAFTLTEISGTAGSIRLRDETWTARSDAGSIPKHTQVSVVRIDGAIAVVVPIIPSTSA
jgi:membrane protein implicated in regulation of membrane protease activity